MTKGPVHDMFIHLVQQQFHGGAIAKVYLRIQQPELSLLHALSLSIKQIGWYNFW